MTLGVGRGGIVVGEEKLATELQQDKELLDGAGSGWSAAAKVWGRGQMLLKNKTWCGSG